MKTPQALRIGLLAAGILGVAAGCRDRSSEADGERAAAGAVEQGGTVVLAEVADMDIPVMLFATGSLDGNLAGDVLNMQLLRGIWEDGDVVYQTADEHALAMARRYEYLGADSSAIRFHMRSDLKWSDGAPITARDIAFTYRLAKDPATGTAHPDYVESVDSVVANNDSTVTFHFGRRYPQMLEHTGIPPLPMHIYQGVAPAQLRSHPTLLDPANGQMVVSGPFMIGEWAKGQQITLVPNPHFAPRPNLDRVVIRIIPDPTTRLVELQTGGVDFVQNVSFDQIPNLKARAPHVGIELEEKRAYDYIAYNPEGFEAFRDPEIRRALGQAINAPQMLQALQMSEYAVPAGGPYSPILRQYHSDEGAPPLAYDPEGAKRVLESKGWRDTNGDGIREKDGQPFRFSLLIGAGNQRRADAAQIVQQQWKQVGVDAQIQQNEFNAWQDQVLGKKDYQAALGGWQIGLSPDLTQLWAGESPYNITGFQSPEVTALFQQALAQPTEEAAAPYWRQAAAGIARQQPYTWLYFMDNVDGLNERVRGATINTYGRYQNLHEWWIPADQRQGVSTATPDTGPR